MNDRKYLENHGKAEINELGIISSTEVPVETLVVLDGELNGFPVKILKDGGCDTIVVSTTFLG